MEKPTGYIGITGFRTLEEVREVNKHINGMPFGYFMYGFTSSNKRLVDPTSAGGTSPRLLDLYELTNEVSRHALPMIHYYTSNPDQLADEVISLYKYCALSRRVGLQLNALWPDPEQIRKIRSHFDTTETGSSWLTKQPITLQIPAEALKSKTIPDILEKLKAYDGLIQYVLIDPSGGKGLDVEKELVLDAGQLMLSIATQFPNITPGVAGGFSFDNVKEKMARIRSTTECGHCHQTRLKDYCIDAQGKLRTIEEIEVPFPKNSPPIQVSRIDAVKVKAYVDAALEAFFAE